MSDALSFVGRMAWRDSRSSRRRLLLFSISITLGVAALVAIGSFRYSLSAAIDDQARNLIGADLIIESSRPFRQEDEKLLHSLGERQAREVRFTTMAVFPRAGGTRLVHVRALGGDFPFYGTMETVPAEAARAFRERGQAVIDESLLLQFQAKTGDPVKLGEREFGIGGALRKVPGEASAAAGFAPRVYIPLQTLVETQLLRPGSVAHYFAYVKFPGGVDVNKVVAQMAPRIQQLGLEYDTFEKRKKDMGKPLANMYRFLNLVGFISLLLGAVGVASAIHAHLEQKARTAAILRCLGAKARSTVFVYLLQAAAMGLAGSTLGAGLGVVLQRIFPRVLQNWLPLTIPTAIAWSPVVAGVGIGFAICVLFALPPLLRLRRISPLIILRGSSDAASGDRRRDLLVVAVYAIIAGSIAAFAVSQTERWTQGLAFAGVLAVAVAVLTGVAKLVIVLVRRFFPTRWPFVWRQGLANLYRPNNRTLLLTLALGLSTFLLLSLYLTRDLLLAQFRSIGSENQPNIFLFDIQPDQCAAVAELVQSLGLPVIQQAPIVTMRLVEIKDRKTTDILADPHRSIPEWELEREYRCTYRDTLTETERITAGQWVGRANSADGDIPISLDEEIAKDFRAGVGDKLVFDVQGVQLKARIASLRSVDWKRFQTNFFVVFPTGVLETAPTFHVLVSRVANPTESARLQNAVVARFPNVSAIDLTSIIQTVDAILSKVALVIRVMSMFTVGAGIVVLASTIWSGRYQRLRESVLLRTLGATRRQIWEILCAEYLFLGLFAAITGIVLALGASWALATFMFKLAYTPDLVPIGVAVAAVTSLTVAIGLLTSRGIGSSPPLQILRAELE